MTLKREVINSSKMSLTVTNQNNVISQKRRLQSLSKITTRGTYRGLTRLPGTLAPALD
jgi:hypothetical protein